MRAMTARCLTCFGLLALVGACAHAPHVPIAPLKADVVYLASDTLEGRMTGSAGEKLAAHYIEERLRELGLEPAFGDSYRQPFDFNAGAKALPGSTLAVGESSTDIKPYGFSKDGKVTGKLCYVGYGVVGADRDDYLGIDVTGAVVVVNRQTSAEIEPSERRELAPFLSARHRTWLAERRGAVGIVFVSDKSSRSSAVGVARGKQTGIAAVGIDRIELERLTGPLDALVPRAAHPHADAICQSSGTAPAKLEVKIAREEGHGQNVAGLLRRTTPGPAAATLVVGAHYDHLGLGEIGSLMEGGGGLIHNGADDNASGTAAILAVAAAARDFERRDYDIVFVAFSGEEIGLVGSSTFVASWAQDTASAPIAAMLNFDMVGRLEETLIVQGVGSSPDWPKLVRSGHRSTPAEFDVRMTDSAYLPTDAMSFYLQKVPVINFFSGAHAEYHKPDDDTELLNYEGISEIASMAANILERLGTRTLPEYAPAPTPVHTTGPGLLQVYLGTIPDYSGKESRGLRLAGVRDGSPAALGGLRAEDVILSIDDTAITDVYAYTYFLSGIAAGAELSIRVQRNGEQLTLTVIPESR
jgi:hypothetical protein